MCVAISEFHELDTLQYSLALAFVCSTYGCVTCFFKKRASINIVPTEVCIDIKDNSSALDEMLVIFCFDLVFCDLDLVNLVSNGIKKK